MKTILFECWAADNLGVWLPKSDTGIYNVLTLPIWNKESPKENLQSAEDRTRPVQGTSSSQYSLDPFPLWRSWRPSMFFHTLRETSSDFLKKGKLAMRSWQRREIHKPGRVRQTLPLLPKLLSNSPDQVRFEAAAAPNVPGKKLKVTILKPW